MLRKRLQGLLISNYRQKDITYMDDINILSSSEEDMVIFDEVVIKFEAQSGFMLSRDKKSKVMGLGQWQGKTDWPLTWIQTVQEMKDLWCVQSISKHWNALGRQYFVDSRRLYLPGEAEVLSLFSNESR